MKKIICGSSARLILLCLLIIVAAALSPAAASRVFAGSGGLSGANIKDGVLKGYYGDGGDIVIPNTVTSIAPEAFKGNDNVTSVTIPGSVSEIGYSAFDSCTALKSVKFSDREDGAALSIRVNAFQNCPKLEDVTIPACAQYVTGNVFKGCTSMKAIKVDPKNKYYFSQDGVLFGPNVIEGTPQYDDKDLTLIAYPAGRDAGTYKIPASVNGRSVTRIWASAFRNCSNLTGIEFPASVTEIGGNAFEGTGLTEVTIPETVKSVDSGQFENCTQLRSVSLPSSVTELDMAFFSGCTSLQRVQMDHVTSIGMYAFRNCTSLTNLILPDSVLSISLSAFVGCTNLQRVFLPAALTAFPNDDLGYYDIFKNTSGDLLVYVIAGSAAEKYAFNNAKDFGWKYRSLTGKSELASVSDGAFPLIDMGRKIKVTGSFRMGSSLNVTEVTKGSQYDHFAATAGDKELKVYQVSLLPSGTTVPSEMDLAVGIPSGILNKNAGLYRLDGDKVVNTNASVVSKTLKTTVSSLGYFAVIGDKDASANPSTPAEPESITLNKTSATLKTGKTLVLSSTVYPENATDKSVTWSSSKESVATVSNGTVKGIAPGESTITARTSNGKEASCAVTVIDGTSISAEQASLTAPRKAASDGTVPFSFVLTDPSRISTVEITFTTDGTDVSIDGKKGFQSLGELKKSEDGTYTAVLSYLGEDRLYSSDGDATVAEIHVKGDRPKAALKSVRIAGWKLDEEVQYGTVNKVNTDEVIFVPLSKYDFNEDGSVDERDLDIAKKHYRTSSADSGYEGVRNCDANGDGIIDVEDLVLIRAAMK